MGHPGRADYTPDHTEVDIAKAATTPSAEQSVALTRSVAIAGNGKAKAAQNPAPAALQGDSMTLYYRKAASHASGDAEEPASQPAKGLRQNIVDETIRGRGCEKHHGPMLAAIRARRAVLDRGEVQ